MITERHLAGETLRKNFFQPVFTSKKTQADQNKQQQRLDTYIVIIQAQRKDDHIHDKIWSPT